jgi:hypothetical protein
MVGAEVTVMNCFGVGVKASGKPWRPLSPMSLAFPLAKPAGVGQSRPDAAPLQKPPGGLAGRRGGGRSGRVVQLAGRFMQPAAPFFRICGSVCRNSNPGHRLLHGEAARRSCRVPALHGRHTIRHERVLDGYPGYRTSRSLCWIADLRRPSCDGGLPDGFCRILADQSGSCVEEGGVMAMLPKVPRPGSDDGLGSTPTQCRPKPAAVHRPGCLGCPRPSMPPARADR